MERAGTTDTEEVLAAQRRSFVRMTETSARDQINSRRTKGEDLPDYDKTLALGPDIIEGNEAYIKEIERASNRNENLAVFIYDLIRKDPKFSALYGTPAKKEEKPPADDKDKEAAGKKTLEKINKNEDKASQSGKKGGGGAGSGTDTEFGGYTLQQLANMSTMEFRKVPRDIREKFLQKYT
jgi:hypothetical protein